jgi:NTE family protein
VVTTALVLSAGGMFGAWQAGVWKVLSGRFRPDLVIGSSAGALNGWAIAGRVAPEELIAAWLDPVTADVNRPRYFPTLLDPKPLMRTAHALFDQYRPQLPFAATLAEVPGLRPRLVRETEMTWRHLFAACSIPFAYPPVRLDGHWYVDGGLLGALPVWAAAELGAERVIAVDALPVIPSRIVRAVGGMARRLGAPRHPPEGLAVTLIRPSLTLGTLREAVYWSAANARRWIESGERDAQRSITM